MSGHPSTNTRGRTRRHLHTDNVGLAALRGRRQGNGLSRANDLSGVDVVGHPEGPIDDGNTPVARATGRPARLRAGAAAADFPRSMWCAGGTFSDEKVREPTTLEADLESLTIEHAA